MPAETRDLILLSTLQHLNYKEMMTVFRGNRELLDAFREGRVDALRTVYFLYVDHVAMILKNGFTEKITGRYIAGVRDPERRLELLQDVFLRAFSLNARLAFDGLRSYKSYLTTIATNIVIDAWRSDTRDPLSSMHRRPEEILQESDPDMLVDVHPPQDSNEELLHWRRCLAASDAYVVGLDSLSREFVRSRFQDALSQHEVALKLGISRSKVRTLEKRIRSGLRKHLRHLNLMEK